MIWMVAVWVVLSVFCTPALGLVCAIAERRPHPVPGARDAVQ
jgi:ABC-type sugar transport system permease subunit